MEVNAYEIPKSIGTWFVDFIFRTMIGSGKLHFLSLLISISNIKSQVGKLDEVDILMNI